jgi:hypothetical protein
MEQSWIDASEQLNAGSSPTNHPIFDAKGYLLLKSLIDPELLKEPAPTERGQLNFDKFGNITQKEITESQVPGSISRYNHPKYVKFHTELKTKIEEAIQSKLYETYFYDRFYFYGQDLKNHTDRDACEISLTLFISSNPEDYEWPIYIKGADGNIAKVVIKPGDGVLYKGCERPHWRDPFKPYSVIDQLLGKHKKAYFHQVFFHYVLSNGKRAHFAFDRGR